MPNEPEKTIEQALHAYAQQRRDESGAPLELHPATRQLFQDEVARTLAKPAAEPTSRFQFLLAAWPRLAFGGAIFATLVFVLVLLQTGPRVGPGGSRMELALHKAELPAEKELLKSLDSSARGEPEAKDRDEAAPKPMATDPSESINEAKRDSYARPTPPPSAAAPMPRSSKLAEAAAGAREEMTRPDLPFKAKSETAEAKANGAPAAPEVAGGVGGTKGLARESRVNRQAGEKQIVEPRRQLRETLELQATPADAAAPAATPQLRMMRAKEPSRPVVADERLTKETAPTAIPNSVYFYDAGGDLRLSFAQEDSRARYRQNLNSPAVPNVLTTFQIERVGNTIRIIDADHSTYTGQIIADEANVITAYSDKEKALPGNSVPRGTPALARRAGNAQAAGFSFQAAGTNQTLNQSVEFYGTIVLDPALTPAGDTAKLSAVKVKTATAAPMSGPQISNDLKQAGIPRGRIQGKAVVGGKNQFEIIAIPATK